MKILVVDDDRSVGALIRKILIADGFVVDYVTSGEEARVQALVNDYDGIVLDLGLSDRHGLTVVQELRREGRDTPVLVLTGDASESTIVRALDAGADDYVTKPVRNRELAARVRALVRRRDRPSSSEQLVAGSLVLNRLTRVVLTEGRPINLAPKEFALLEHLLLHRDEVVTRADLLEHVWDTTFDPGTNVVDVQVGRLRRKLKQAGVDARIETRRGAGLILRTS
jgi:two-component system, OmpR family, response regulator